METSLSLGANWKSYMISKFNCRVETKTLQTAQDTDVLTTDQ